MDTEKLQNILRPFKDYGNRNYQNPIVVKYKEREYYAATNGWCFIFVPATEQNHIDQDDLTHNDSLSKRMVEVIPELMMDYPLSIEKVIRTHASIEVIQQDVQHECESCEGNTKFKHHDHWYACKQCNETGTVKTGETEMVKNPLIAMQLFEDGPIFNSRFVLDMLNAMYSLGNRETLKVKASAQNGLTVFEIGESILIGLSAIPEISKHEYTVVQAF